MNRRSVSVASLVVFIVGGAVALAGAATSPESFRDCTTCPQMVTVPAGEFTMGSPSSELYRGSEAQHRVRIPRPFAMGRYEVTFAQWDACVADDGCGAFKPDDQGWGRGNRPVVGVSWEDAKRYVAWLSKKTGKKYRLPSEAEWEYAARARTTTPFYFGATITAAQANYDGSTGYGKGPKGQNRMKTVPVGSFPPNAFGLYDMHGNVWEWTEDCWADEYSAKTPSDGSPLISADCRGHAMRGGSWEDYPGDVRSAARVASGAQEQSWSDGFRVAMTIE